MLSWKPLRSSGSVMLNLLFVTIESKNLQNSTIILSYSANYHKKVTIWSNFRCLFSAICPMDWLNLNWNVSDFQILRGKSQFGFGKFTWLRLIWIFIAFQCQRHKKGWNYCGWDLLEAHIPHFSFKKLIPLFLMVNRMVYILKKDKSQLQFFSTKVTIGQGVILRPTYLLGIFRHISSNKKEC